MSLLGLNAIVDFNEIYWQPTFVSQTNMMPSLWGVDQLNSKFQSKKYNENLMLNNGRPEVGSETKLSNEELMRLKQSPARQKLSGILQKCNDKVLAIKEEDTDLINIINRSKIFEKFDFKKQLDKNLIGKTKKVISVIQGIYKLDTAHMTEEQMEAKVKEYSAIIDDAVEQMKTIRQFLFNGAQLATKYMQSQVSGNKNCLDSEIEQFGLNFTKFVEEGTTDSSKNKKNPFSSNV